MSAFDLLPVVHVMEGVPESEKLKNRLNQHGFQNIVFIPRPVVGKKEHPRDYVRRFLTQVLTQEPENKIVLSYTVACGRRILDIPTTQDEAREMLQLLSGRRHQIWICFGCKSQDKMDKICARTIMTRVNFKRLTTHEIENYILSHEWKGRSGGYHSFDKAAAFIKSVNGSPTALSGLPEYEWSSFVQSATFRYFDKS